MNFMPLFKLSIPFSSLVLLLGISSCSDSSNQLNDSYKTSKNIEDLNDKFDNLSSKIEELENVNSKFKKTLEQIENLESRIKDIEIDAILDTLELVRTKEFYKHIHETNLEFEKVKENICDSTVVFNLKCKDGYSKINSDGIILLVSVHNVSPYLEGYKVVFRVGNLTSANFNNPKVTVSWNKERFKFLQNYSDKTKDISEIFDIWKKQSKHVNYTSVVDLKPASWNYIEVLLTPATLEEIEDVEFKIELNSTSLNN